MHAIIDCPARPDFAVARRDRSRDFDLPDRRGGIVTAEARSSRLGSGSYHHGRAQNPGNGKHLQPV